MAKFKKKKSKPTSGDDSKKSNIKEEDVNNKSQTPPTEKIDDENVTNKKPKNESALSETESSESKKKLDKLFWIRIGLAVIAGSIATFLFDPITDFEERRWASIGFMIVVFIGSVIIGKAMRIQLASSDRKKLVTNGLGSYIFIYLFMWIVTYTLVNVSETGGGITSPIP